MRTYVQDGKKVAQPSNIPIVLFMGILCGGGNIGGRTRAFPFSILFVRYRSNVSGEVGDGDGADGDANVVCRFVFRFGRSFEMRVVGKEGRKDEMTKGRSEGRFPIFSLFLGRHAQRMNGF